MSANTISLLESISLRDGRMELLPYHQERVNQARRKLLGIKQPLSLARYLRTQDLPDGGNHKIRLVYGRSIEDFSCTAYTPRTVGSLRVVQPDPIDYRFKYADRKALDSAFTYRDGCDDILISSNGFLTDTLYGNIALYDGKKWWTPAHPLLKGVRRAALIDQHALHPTVVRVPDLRYFQEVRIINAMIPLAESVPIPVEKVFLPGQLMR